MDAQPIIGGVGDFTRNQFDEIMSGSSSAQQTIDIGNNSNDTYLDLYNRTRSIDYLEKYLDNLMAEKSVNDARAWQKAQDDTQYSRAIANIKAAGLNPWILLQSGISAAGSNSVSSASYSKNSATEAISTRRNNARIAEESNLTKIIVSVVAGAALIAKALI